MNNDVERVMELINTCGKTKRQIAQDLKIPEQRLYAWVNKGSRPSYEDLQKLMAYFRVVKTEKYEPVISVLIDKVSECLSLLKNTSITVERERVLRDVEYLKGGEKGSGPVS